MIVNGLVWVPQILKNSMNKARNVPDNKFIISMTLTQSFLPLYLRGCPNNQFLAEPNQTWSFFFLLLITSQVLILIFQKKLGARFFLPEKYRYWNEFNYYKNLDENDVEEGETECCICLNPLSYLCDHFRTEETNTRRAVYQRIIYMQTPCFHKFHVDCLKPWMQQKLECPKCRGELPALDEEEY